MNLRDRGFDFNGEFVTLSRVIDLANFIISDFFRAEQMYRTK
jgi:hypothetical protein